MPRNKRKSSSSAAPNKTPAKKKANNKANNAVVTPVIEAVSTGGSSKCTPKQIVAALRHILVALPRYHDLWFTSEDYVSILKQNYRGLDGLTTTNFTRAINSDATRPFGGRDNMKNYSGGNEFGVYANEIEASSVGKKTRQRIWCYLLTKKPTCPKPPTPRNFELTDLQSLSNKPSRVRPPVMMDTSQNNNSSSAQQQQQQEQPQQQQQPQQQPQLLLRPSEQLAQQNYFHSPEAWKLFMPKGAQKPNFNASCDIIVRNFIEARIAVLREGITNWYTVVQGGSEKHDASEYAVEKIENKCRYLVIALQYALGNMGKVERPTWRRCCEHAIETMALACNEYVSHWQTIEEWHIQLRDSGEDKFPHPNPQVAAGEVVDPPFFVACPGAKLQFLSHADEMAKKGELTSEALADHVNSTIIPFHLKEYNNGKDEANRFTRSEFLRSFGLGTGQGRPPKQLDGDDDENAQPQEKINICSQTVLNWMNRYGYVWCDARKHYYNDTHEHPQTIKARSLYIHALLFQYETRALRWIQIPKEDADMLRQLSADGKQHIASDAGYEYNTKDSDGNEIVKVECHVDDCKSFQKYMLENNKCGEKSHLFIHAPVTLVEQWFEEKLFDEKSTPKKAGYYYDALDEAGTKMVEVHARHFIDDNDTRSKLHKSMKDNNIWFGQSVRPPLIIFGQDEAIYRQYLMTLKVWAGRGGKQPQRPKDQGQGLMISAIKSRDFGFGYDLTAEQLARVNEFRQTQRPEYSDRDAALKVKGTTTKPSLKESPFVEMFEYGNSAEGYWTYDRMICQVEDCIDTLDALHSSPLVDENGTQRHMTRVPNTRDALVRHFDYAFGFDWSNGHDRKKPDALDFKDMTKGPSACARKMRDSKIESADYLGPHDPKLEVGQTQKMQFEETNYAGGVQSGPQLWTEEKRQVRYNVIDGKKMVKKNKEELKFDLELHKMVSAGTVKQLIERCKAANIPLEKEVDNIVKQGFIGIPKGMYEILWERGFIDPNVETYTIDGVKDPTGRVMVETSLKHLMQQLPDFENEKTLLHYHGEQLGCIIFNSPKCTPEVAGEGIEYDWGVSKLWYRVQDFKLKKSRTSFKALVKNAIGSKVLSLRMARDNAKRAREHMISYYKLEKNGDSTLPSDVKKMMATRKSHSSVIDMDKGFVSAQLKAMAQATNAS